MLNELLEVGTVGELFKVGTVVVLSAAFPLSIIAARGFWSTPFGAVLKPLPVVIVVYLAYNIPIVAHWEFPVTYFVILSTIGTVSAFVGAANLFLLLTERKPV